MLTGLPKAGRQTSRTIVEQKKSTNVARFVTPKNPFCVMSISTREQNFTVSFLVLYLAVFIYCFLQHPLGTVGFWYIEGEG